MAYKPKIYSIDDSNSSFGEYDKTNQPNYTGEVQYESFSDLIEKPKKKGFLGLMRQGSGGRSRRHKRKTTRRHKRKMRSTRRRKSHSSRRRRK
jgi:hypothetical protein